MHIVAIRYVGRSKHFKLGQSKMNKKLHGILIFKKESKGLHTSRLHRQNLEKSKYVVKIAYFGSNFWPLECSQDAPMIWPGEIVFIPKNPQYYTNHSDQ